MKRSFVHLKFEIKAHLWVGIVTSQQGKFRQLKRFRREYESGKDNFLCKTIRVFWWRHKMHFILERNMEKRLGKDR